ncbi:MAG: ester cyclase [Prochlorotrichaceae cyanobacterium]|jgi:predicted ester cyclase
MLSKTISALIVAGCLFTGTAALADTGIQIAEMHGSDMDKMDMEMHEMHMDMNPAMESMHMDLKAVQTFYEMLSNPNDPDLAEKAAEVIDVNWDSEPTPRGGDGLDGFVKSIQAFGQLIPDLNWEPQEVLQDGNRYIVRSIATGTPVQPFFGVQPQGKSFEIMSIDIHTVENGKIVTSYHIEEWATAIMQLQQP